MGFFDDLFDEVNQVTSNAAAVLRGVIEASKEGIELSLANLAPLADQLDRLLVDPHQPIPAPPEGGVPIDRPLEGSNVEAAAYAHVVG